MESFKIDGIQKQDILTISGKLSDEIVSKALSFKLNMENTDNIYNFNKYTGAFHNFAYQ